MNTFSEITIMNTSFFGSQTLPKFSILFLVLSMFVNIKFFDASYTSQIGWMIFIAYFILVGILRGRVMGAVEQEKKRASLKRFVFGSVVVGAIGAALAVYWFVVGDTAGMKSALGGLFFVATSAIFEVRKHNKKISAVA